MVIRVNSKETVFSAETKSHCSNIFVICDAVGSYLLALHCSLNNVTLSVLLLRPSLFGITQ